MFQGLRDRHFGVAWLLVAAMIGMWACSPRALAEPPLAQKSTATAAGLLPATDDFLPVTEAFKPLILQEGPDLVATWTIAEGYYLYQERFRFDPLTPGASGSPLQFDRPGVIKHDEYFGDVTVYHDTVTVRMTPALEGVGEAEFKITYQGCAEAGLCYPPQHLKTVFVAPDARGASQPAMESGDGSANSASKSPPQTDDNDVDSLDRESASSILNFLGQAEGFTVIGLFFLLGIGLAFTPCVFPMIPILSSIIAGQQNLSTGRAFSLSLAYVLGMAITYAGAGMLVASLGAGANLQAMMQAPWLLSLFALVFVLLALAMFGFYELQLPAFLRDRLNRAGEQSRGGTLASVLFMGALSALVVSPCVSAPLAGALLYISTTGDLWLGGGALLALGLGMGVPLLVIGTGGGKFLPRAGAWMESVKQFFGVALLAVAIWLLERIVPAPLILGLWALLLGVYAVFLGAFDSIETGWKGWQRFRKGLALMLFAYAILLLTGAASGASDPLRPLAATFSGSAAQSSDSGYGSGLDFAVVTTTQALDQRLAAARTADRPVMIDVYADWCISCKVMERTVLSDARVREALAGHQLIKLDVTENTADTQSLLERYDLFGPPAYLFFDAQGVEQTSSRIMGEMKVDAFLQHLARL